MGAEVSAAGAGERPGEGDEMEMLEGEGVKGIAPHPQCWEAGIHEGREMK